MSINTTEASRCGLVIAAGRRIDDESGDEVRFPARHLARVAQAVERWLRETRPAQLVASAACGADLIVLEAARCVGVRTVVVLPFDRVAFRAASVVDRGAEWGGRFDMALAAADRVDVLDTAVRRVPPPDADAAYTKATAALLAVADVYRGTVCALVAWDGASHGEQDQTAALRDAAITRGWPVHEIRTD